MPPDELRAILAHWQMTIRAFGQWCGIEERTARRWTHPEGEGAPAAVAKLVRYMVATGATPAKVDRAIARYAATDDGPGKRDAV